MVRLECLNTNKEKVSHYIEFILKSLRDFEAQTHLEKAEQVLN